MLKQLYNRYTSLSIAKQIGISFLANLVFWFSVSYFVRTWFFDKEFSLSDHTFNAVFMAIFMTLFSKWKRLAMLFKGANKS